MFEVHIYIGTDSASTRKSKRSYGYVLECMKNGEPRTVQGFGETESTYHETNLIAINEALRRLNQSCEVHIHTEDHFILNMIEHNLEKWVASDFRTSKGRPVESEEHWRRLWELSQKQLILSECGKHSYSEWIQEEIERRRNHV